MNKNLKKLIYSAMCLALCLVLPFLTGQIPEIGKRLSPMHIPVFLCGFLYIGFEFIHSLALFGKIDLFIQQLGMAAHYSSLSRGVIDTRDLIYFLSVIVLFLSLTKLTLSSRKW